MWVLTKESATSLVVGYYVGKLWTPVFKCRNMERAIRLVHYLNGGSANKKGDKGLARLMNGVTTCEQDKPE